MESQVNPTNKTPEEIEREMLSTRESLAEKVVALESQVVGTVQTAADTFTDTVQAVRSLVTDAPGAVSDTVKQAAAAVSETMKETFDISTHVRNNPWASVGVAAGVGFLAGAFLLGGRSQSSGSATDKPRSAGSPPPTFIPPAASASAATASAPSRPAMFDALFAMLGTKLKDLAEAALESTTASLKTNIQDGIPKLVNEAAAHLVEPQSRVDDYPTERSVQNGAHRARV